MRLPPGLLISAPASGTGKTTVTLGLLAALRARGIAVQPFKSGPDYIDPAFHTAAAGRTSVNIDSWAMTPARLTGLVATAQGADLVIAEGSMGLFDGVAVAGETGTGEFAEKQQGVKCSKKRAPQVTTIQRKVGAVRVGQKTKTRAMRVKRRIVTV